MFGDLFGGYAAREMRRTVSESRPEREERVHDRVLRRRLAREERTAGGVRMAGMFSLLAPFLALGAAFLIVHFVPDRRTASALTFICTLLVIAGLLAGMWALCTAGSNRIRAGRGMAIAGICIGGLLMLLLVLSPSLRRASRRISPVKQQTP